MLDKIFNNSTTSRILSRKNIKFIFVNQIILKLKSNTSFIVFIKGQCGSRQDVGIILCVGCPLQLTSIGLFSSFTGGFDIRFHFIFLYFAS